MAGDRQRYQQAMTQGAQFAWDSDWRAAIEQYEIARVRVSRRCSAVFAPWASLL